MSKQTQKTTYIDNDSYEAIEKLMDKNDRPYNYVVNELIKKGLKG